MSKMITRSVLAAAVLGLASLVPSPARADLIDVQFNTSGTATYGGAAVLGAAGDVWNAFGQNTESGASGSGSLVRSDGTASGVTLSYSTPNGFFDASGGGALFDGTPYANLMTAYLFADNHGVSGPGTVSFAGLTPGDSYQLSLYSAANSAGRITDFTLSDGQMQSVTPSGSATFAKGNTYADFTTTANSQGGLSITITTGNADEGDLNGIQLQDLGPTAVPEPSTAIVAAFGAVAFLAYGWSRHRRAQRRQAAA